MTVRAKMKCNMVPATEAAIADESVQKIALGAVWEPDEGKRALPENAVYGKATPWGECVMGISNPAAKAFFKPGASYYVTFERAPD